MGAALPACSAGSEHPDERPFGTAAAMSSSKIPTSSPAQEAQLDRGHGPCEGRSEQGEEQQYGKDAVDLERAGKKAQELPQPALRRDDLAADHAEQRIDEPEAQSRIDGRHGPRQRDAPEGL